MTAIIRLYHDDPMFAGSLAEALRAIGHEVETFSDPSIRPPPPRASIVPEIAINRSTTAEEGVRLRITGMAGGQHAGPLGDFVPAPYDVDSVVRAVRRFLPA